MKYIADIGSYFIMLYHVFRTTTKWSIMFKLILKEIDDLVFKSIPIISFMAFFVGGVVAVQTSLNLENPTIPRSLVGFATRQSFLLEFAPTFMSVIMVGKAGSFITSSIGTMRVTEQIDALDVMGVNSLNYLIFPKIIAMLLYPFVISLALVLGMAGGLISCTVTGYTTANVFIEGIQMSFETYDMVYAYTKSFIFAFIIATIPAYQGYYMKGGALDVGKASTQSFVWTSMVIIILNSFITQIFYG